MRKKIPGLMLLLAFLMAISPLGCIAQKTVIEQEKIKVTRGNIVVSVNAEGELSLPQQQKLTFGLTGTIEQVYVEEGDKVTKGKVLAKLETASLERAVRAAELAIKSAEVDLKLAEDGVTAATIDLEQANDNYRKILYPYTYSTFAFDVPQALDYISSAERQVREAQKALQSGLTADQHYEALRQLKLALDNLTDARQRLARGEGTDVFSAGQRPVKDFWTLRAAQLQMEKAQAAVDNAKTVVNKARLAVDKAKYDRDTAKETLDKAVLTATFDGIIAKANAKAGDTLMAMDYTKVAFELIDPWRMELTIKVDEIDIPGVKLGQEATISIDALPNTRFKGKVIFISPLPKIEAGVVLYEVKIGFDVPEGSPLKAGMSSSADILVDQQDNVLVVPNRAITHDKTGKPTVKLLVNGQIQERVVETGVSNNFDTEVVSGLDDGDTIVIERQVKTTSTGFFGG